MKIFFTEDFLYIRILDSIASQCLKSLWCFFERYNIVTISWLVTIFLHFCGFFSPASITVYLSKLNIFLISAPKYWYGCYKEFIRVLRFTRSFKLFFFSRCHSLPALHTSTNNQSLQLQEETVLHKDSSFNRYICLSSHRLMLTLLSFTLLENCCMSYTLLTVELEVRDAIKNTI